MRMHCCSFLDQHQTSLASKAAHPHVVAVDDGVLAVCAFWCLGVLVVAGKGVSMCVKVGKRGRGERGSMRRTGIRDAHDDETGRPSHLIMLLAQQDEPIGVVLLTRISGVRRGSNKEALAVGQFTKAHVARQAGTMPNPPLRAMVGGTVAERLRWGGVRKRPHHKHIAGRPPAGPHHCAAPLLGGVDGEVASPAPAKVTTGGLPSPPGLPTLMDLCKRSSAKVTALAVMPMVGRGSPVVLRGLGPGNASPCEWLEVQDVLEGCCLTQRAVQSLPPVTRNETSPKCHRVPAQD